MPYLRHTHSTTKTQLKSSMAEKSQTNKWEGKATATLKGSKAEQVWPFWEDFFNFHRYYPGIDTCYQVEVPGQTGLIRYCASTVAQPSSDSGVDDVYKSQSSTTLWANEKLIYNDPIQMSLSYEVLDNNMSMKNYVATIKVLPIDEDGDGASSGCRIEWTFVVDPIEGWTLEHLVGYLENKLRLMAKNLEEEALKENIA